jgi:hypothetical protein
MISLFSDLEPGEERDKLLIIAGKIQAFGYLFGSFSISNKPTSLDYDPAKPQGIMAVIYSENDPEPDTGYYFTIYADNLVEVMHLSSYPVWKDGKIDKSQPRELEREDYVTSLSSLLLWLRAQPPTLDTFLHPCE